MFAASKSGSVDAKDPQFNYVTMLLHGDGTNGSQNNTFVDSSTNNFTITRNGNTTQGTFTPYGDNWSNYFGGSQSLSNGTNVTASGDFTLECWLNLSSYSAARIFFSVGNETANRRAFFIDSSGVIKIDLASVGATSLGGSIPTNTWTHLAITRSSNTVTAYVNGVATGTTATISGTFGNANGFYVGSVSDNSNSMVGYISNLRWVLGSVVYTSTFTPSTTPLTAITNTSLLTCQSNRFVDNSSNAFAITVNSTPSVQRFSPFSPTTVYSTSVIGGSGYFDGSGDYLTTPQNAAFNIGTGQFTVECFIYWNGTALANGGYGLINLGNGANGGGPFTGWGLILDFDSGGKPTFYRFDGTVYSYQSSTNPTANQWIHLAVSRNSSNTLSIWMNGIRVYTATVTTSFNNVNSDPLNIGYRQDGGTGGTHYFPGYISNARVVVGTDVYGAANSTITVPTAPLTAITNTSLLLNYTNAGILDNAMMNDLETVGNAQISTSVKKYGTGSMAFDGTGDYLLLQGGQNFTFGTGDFTIEMWIYVVSGLNADIVYYDGRPTSTNGLYNIIYTNSTGKLVYSTNSADRITGTTTLSTGTWYHIALSRSGTSTKLFLNGTQEASTYTDSNSYIVGANRPVIGGNGYTLGNAPLNGYIDDLRITKGVARYTANFTAPTAAFADKG